VEGEHLRGTDPPKSDCTLDCIALYCIVLYYVLYCIVLYCRKHLFEMTKRSAVKRKVSLEPVVIDSGICDSSSVGASISDTSLTLGESSTTINSSVPKKYDFKILSVLNEGNPSAERLSQDLLKGAKTVIEIGFKADESLNQFFLEIVILAYNLNCVGSENIMNFMEQVWKVILFFSF